MRRYRPFMLLGLAAIIAFSTSSLVYRWLSAQATVNQAVVEAPVSTVEVAVAAANIPRGSSITQEMLRTARFPEEILPEGSYKAAEIPTIVGRVVVTDILQNELVIGAKLAAVGGSGGVAAILDPAKRAMSVRVDDEVGVAGFVKPGDRVDLFVTVERDGGGAEREVVAKLVLANTPVLAIGTEMLRTGKDEEAKPVKVITLEVSPEEAEKLALASSMGKFRLALRSPLSKDDVVTKGATVASLLSSYRAGAQKGDDVPTGHGSVQLIKGKEVSTVSF